MYAQDLLVSSPIPWFVSHANEVIDIIASESEITHDMFRRDEVQDPTLGQRVPTAAQRLIRWSDRPPEEVFVSGFRPITIPYEHNGNGPFPAGACNLGRYVRENTPSIFVGAAQPYRNARGKTSF